MSRSYLSALVGGLTSQFFSAQTGQGMYGSDPAASVQINTMRPALTTQQLEAWAAHPIYSRLSGALPGSAMAGGLTVAVLDPQGKANADGTAELQTAIDDAEMRLKVLETLRYSLRDGVAGLWLLDATVKDQREPLDPETAKIAQIHALSRFDMTPAGEVVSDAASKFYGWPEFVKVSLPMGKYRAAPTICHISRVRCVAGLRPVSTTATHVQDLWDGYGVPLCRGLGETIQNIETGAASAAGLAPRISQPVITLNPKTMSEARVNQTMREKVEARLELARTSRSLLGMFVLGEGEKFENVNARTEGFGDVIKALQDDLVLKWGMPRTLAYGETPGGLTASSAPFMDAWRLRVDEYREGAQPLIEYVARCLLSTIGASGSNFRVEWAALTPANALTDAQADNAKAQTAAVLVQSGVLGADTAAEWLRAQGVDLPEAATFDPQEGAGEGIATALSAEGEPAAVDPAAEVSAQGVAPVTAQPKEPYPVGFITAALEAAKAVNSGEVRASQARGILKSMMGVDPAGAQEIAPDDAEGTVTAAQETQSNSATDATPAGALWIGAVPASEEWEERLAPLRAAVAEILPGFEVDAEPHLTVLYLGAVAGDVADLAVDEAQRAVRRMLAEPGVVLPAFRGSVIGFMLPDKSGRQAVALIGEAWGLYQVRDDLQAALGEMIAPDVRRFPWRPHVTLGYVPNHRDVTPAQRERVGGIMYRRAHEDVVLPISLITVRADGETSIAALRTFDAAAPIAPPETRQSARAALAARDAASDAYAPAVWAALYPVARGEPVNSALLRALAGSGAPGSVWAQGIVDAPRE